MRIVDADAVLERIEQEIKWVYDLKDIPYYVADGLVDFLHSLNDIFIECELEVNHAASNEEIERN